MAEGEARLVAGRYRLGEPLGRGGMGVVWHARDEFLHRDVAVKEINLRFGLADQAERATQRTLREARAAARLRHPSIVAVYDVVIDDDRPLIVMELVEGRSLAQVIREDGVLSEQRTADVGRQVLSALEVAHASGILHRDVKPANILLDGDRVMLTDFGIAAVAGATPLTDTNVLVGSPEYLAPERVDGRPAAAASDFWSVGVTLCAALRGESPFQREDTSATLAAVLTYEPPPVVEAGWLWPVIAGLLRKNPAERLTARTAVARLAVLSAGEPPTRRLSPSAPVPAPRLPDRRRILALLAVFALVVAVTAVWLVLRPRDTAADNPPTSTPAGFTVHKDPAGFSIAIPSGWRKGGFEQEVDWTSSEDPRESLWVHVQWQDGSPRQSAAEYMVDFERYELSAGPVSDYRRIKLTTGDEIADLECTYRYTKDAEFYAHDLMQTIITESGRRFTLTLASQSLAAASTEALWNSSQRDLTVILRSFHVAA